jgi:hypothetical protein
MALHITVAQAQAWAEGTKLTVSSIDPNLEAHMATEVISRLSSLTSTTGWTDSTNTPLLVQTIISKMYMAWLYDRQYSEDVTTEPSYADRLRANAEMLMQGLLAGSIELPGIVDVAGSPAFYPTDASSALSPTLDDPSLGPAAFSMGKMF